MTAADVTVTASDATEVAERQRAWIHGWDRIEGAPEQPFEAVFAPHHDMDADVILFDDADPQRRVFRRVADYADAFWPTFQALRSARHAIPEGPDVIVSGDLAVARMAFVAELVPHEGEPTRLRCQTSHVWRRTAERDWHVVRDQTACEPIAAEALEAAFAAE
ncbi:Cif family virulence factor [Agrococcus jejuensis]|uniref:SnoaL-like domain-containing protein n=1 Tax=Agrococcus jejuensis TaxID=399736 RepID=A0A1G8E8Q7_9MICO|nr:hypothetical protein [Agrococcus jejuensis]SDH66029.1 hypothetical protein SAMN04489720_1924 [Agrococcus jejuensis]